LRGVGRCLLLSHFSLYTCAASVRRLWAGVRVRARARREEGGR
jgi:hypothetical protein